MYTYFGIGLLGIVALMVTPYGLLDASSDGKFYGAATIVALDAYGNETLRSIVHNQVTDVGEEMLLDNTFQDAGNIAVADIAQIGSICIMEGTIVVAETETATDFDGDNTINPAATSNCIEADFTMANDGTAVIGPLTFTDDVHLVTLDDINGIGICSANAGTTPYDDCATGNGAAGVLFAVVDTADVTINAGESVQITYTFDISSGST